MRTLLLLVLGLCLASQLPAQKFIQLEKANRAKTIKFYVGQDLTYRLKGQTEWATALITDVQMDSQLIALNWKTMPVSNIEAIRLQHSGFVRSLGPMLMLFGASWVGYSVVGAVFYDDPLTASTAIVSGTSIATGYLLHRIFKHKTIRMRERRRLRAVEIPVMGEE
ncbi:MAG: hypothetical protein EP344_18455 [Bacteroidetes bacterium]|nr:MAG: hypothetical protein EP344_18455 [Bacteroidota bacterium]